MSPQDERETVEAAVHATIVRWSNGEQPKPLKAMVADAILALRQPGAEYRRAVEACALHLERQADRDAELGFHDRSTALREEATAIRALTDAKEVGGGR
jgi:hypothetical protein